MRNKIIAVCAAVAVLACFAGFVWPALTVKPDEENVVASRLVGKWKPHKALTARLTGRAARGGRFAELEFVADPAVAGRLPAKYEALLKDTQIFLAGTMNFKRRAAGSARQHEFVLICHRGNPYVVWFRPAGGDPMGDAEGFNVMLAIAKKTANDLLFVGGDFNNQPFSAYERVVKKDK